MEAPVFGICWMELWVESIKGMGSGHTLSFLLNPHVELENNVFNNMLRRLYAYVYGCAIIFGLGFV